MEGSDRNCEDTEDTTRFNRVQEDVSGLTFQEWTPDVDTSRTHVGDHKFK